MGQQASGRNVLVDHLSRYRRLDQCFALGARPFSTHMLLNCEHTRGVIELLAEVFTDTLKLSSTGALGVLRFVMYHYARKLRRQWDALGLLT